MDDRAGESLVCVPDLMIMMIMNRMMMIMTINGLRSCELAISDDHDVMMRVILTINGVE